MYDAFMRVTWDLEDFGDVHTLSNYCLSAHIVNTQGQGHISLLFTKSLGVCETMIEWTDCCIKKGVRVHGHDKNNLQRVGFMITMLWHKVPWLCPLWL
jgi:hypothetical protein